MPSHAQPAPPDSSPLSAAPAPRRVPYVAARLEALGPWRALTLQQSIPIGPGSALLLDPERIPPRLV